MISVSSILFGKKRFRLGGLEKLYSGAKFMHGAHELIGGHGFFECLCKLFNNRLRAAFWKIDAVKGADHQIDAVVESRKYSRNRASSVPGSQSEDAHLLGVDEALLQEYGTATCISLVNGSVDVAFERHVDQLHVCGTCESRCENLRRRAWNHADAQAVRLCTRILDGLLERFPWRRFLHRNSRRIGIDDCHQLKVAQCQRSRNRVLRRHDGGGKKSQCVSIRFGLSDLH